MARSEVREKQAYVSHKLSEVGKQAGNSGQVSSMMLKDFL